MAYFINRKSVDTYCSDILLLLRQCLEMIASLGVEAHIAGTNSGMVEVFTMT